MIPDFLWLVLHIFESCSLITFFNLVLVTLWISFLSSSSSDKNSFYPVPKLYFRWVATINWSVVLPPDMGEKEKKDQKKRKKITFHASTKSKPYKHAPMFFMFIFAHCRTQFSSSSYINPHICHLVQEVLMPVFIHLNLVLFVISKSVILSRKFLRLFLHILNLVFFIMRY